MTSLVAEPIYGWKTAQLVAVDGQVRFAPISAPGTYGAVETAECRPVTGVTPTRTRADDDPYMATLDATLAKMGVENLIPRHDPVVPDPDCTCGFYARKHRPDTIRRNVLLRVALSGRVIIHQRGYRAQHQQVEAVEIPRGGCHRCGRPSTRIRIPTDGPVVTGCENHADQHPADLAGLLGVEVTWSALTPVTDVYEMLNIAMRNMSVTMQQDASFATFFAVDPARPAAGGHTATFVAVDELTDDTPDSLEAKRRRDEERQRRLEQLAGPARPPRHIRPRGTR